MRMNHAFAVSVVAAIAAVSTVACRSVLTGNEGNLRFSYTADDQIRDFNKPIAVGAKLDIKVEGAGLFDKVTLLSATSDDESVLKIVSFQDDTVIVQGIGSGNVLLSVTARKGDGTEVPDNINLNVRVPDELVLVHTCEPAADEGLWLTDNAIFFQYEMKENNRPAIGYGYHPVTFDPPVMTPDVVTKDQQWMHLTTPSTAQTVTLSSTIDNTTKTMRIVAPGEINGARVQADLIEAWVGSKTWIYLLPTLNDKPICQAQTDLTVIETTTPAFCTVTRPASNPNTGSKNEWGWVQVEGKAVGRCEFRVNYEQGNGGAGTDITLGVDVNEVVQPAGGQNR